MAFGRPSEKDNARELAYRNWFERQHPLALASLLLSVFSLTHLGTLFVDSIAGVVLGIITLAQTARARSTRHATGDAAAPPQRVEGRRLAWAGIVVGILSLVIGIVIYSLPAATPR